MGDPLSEEVAAWLEKLHLGTYIEKARAWCNDSGAVSVAEILENLDDFATKLQLKKLERKRVEKELGAQATPAHAAAATAAAALRPGAPPGGAASPASQSTAATVPSAHPPISMATGFFGPADNPQKYTLGKELGQGATATVYECWCDSKIHAVKTISLTKLRLQPGFQRMADTLRREVSILFQLRHPRIVSLHDVVEAKVGNNPDKLHLVMDYVKGGELFERIVQEGAFQEQPTARYVFLQIAEGLKYIHSKDIVYRDLKPENILVDDANSTPGYLEIKLSDFGHSKLINDGYSTALTRVGTPQYWAPEVSDPRMAAQGYDQRVDLWSLGVVLYVLLIGAYPFDGFHSSIEDQIRQAQVEFRQSALGCDISDLAKELVRALIKVKPDERLSLDGCLGHKWVVSKQGSNFHRLLKLETEINPRVAEERLSLPCTPNREQVAALRRDLHVWMTKFHCSAKLANEQIIATLGDETVVGPDQIRNAREELCQIINYNCGQYPKERAAASVGGRHAVGSGGYPGTLPAVREHPPFRLLTHNLRVDAENGAGLDLQPEQGGMRVENVYEVPGQPGLVRGDIIVKINEVSLRGSVGRVENIFAKEFKDGVQVQVKRHT